MRLWAANKLSPANKYRIYTGGTSQLHLSFCEKTMCGYESAYEFNSFARR